MKPNFIHVCFIIDSSGSMYQSVNDVRGGYAQTIKDQLALEEGECAVSLFTFETHVHEHYVLKDIKEVEREIEYSPSGWTAMNDGIGTAITRIGKKLAEMPEDERPSQNLIVIMTDGEENASTEYNFLQIKEMIKEQTEKYSWKFVYFGTDLTNAKDVNNLGIKSRGFSSRSNMYSNYDVVNNAVKTYRMSDSNIAAATMDSYITTATYSMSEEYEKTTGIDVDMSKDKFDNYLSNGASTCIASSICATVNDLDDSLVLNGTKSFVQKDVQLNA